MHTTCFYGGSGHSHIVLSRLFFPDFICSIIRKECTMAVLERSNQLILPGGFVTVVEAARLKQVNVEAMRRWIVNNNVTIARVGRTVLVRAADLEAYSPRRY